MRGEKDYFLFDTKKRMGGRELTNEEKAMQCKMLFIKIIFLVDITTIFLLLSYLISYWGGL
jgi:hypothetical protein